MKKMLTFRNLLISLPILAILLTLHYVLPQVDVVRAVGVEIKRMDIQEPGTGQLRTRDVNFLQTETPNGKPQVYRNEDNPFYGKFDSADLQAQIQSFSAGKQLIALRHYGWRIRALSIFPNAVKAWPVKDGYWHIPVFNLTVLALLAMLATLGIRKMRRVAGARANIRQSRAAERMERGAVQTRMDEAAALH